MRLLLCRSSTPTALGDAFAAAGQDAGHRVEVLELPQARRRWPTVAPQWIRRLALARPQAALLEVGPAALILAPLLKAAQVPFGLVFGPTDEAGAGPAWRGVAPLAKLTLATSEATARAISEQLQLPEVLAFGPQLDLGPWPLADRREARVALGLPPEGHYLGLIAALEPPLPLDRLALAHRKVPGAGLLVAGGGSLSGVVAAMGAATRPSSPVLWLGPRSPTHDLAVALAADVHLCLEPTGPSDACLVAAALGRRQVNLHEGSRPLLERLYPSGQPGVFGRPDGADLEGAIRQALELESTSGPLEAAAVARARRALDRSTLGARLLSLVCGPS